MPTLSFPETETTLLFPGPSGVLEVLITPASASTSSPKVAIICHPHPLQGGTMDNKVVTITSKTLHSLGFSTIRFNYRGVGKSEGEFGDFIGETADLLSILDWVREVLPDVSFCLAGFSFGSYIAAQGTLQRSDYVKQLINIAPAVNHSDFSVFTGIKCPWLIIQGTEDEVVPAAEVRDFIKQLPLSARIKLVEIPEATHFFHGKLLEVRDIIVENIEFR